jgi:hypothetical protein
MYEASSTLVAPRRTLQPLWRYLSAQRLLDLLATGELYFAHLPVLEDQNEGALTARSRERLADWFQHHNKSTRLVAYQEVDKYQENRAGFYVNCWHMNNHESYLMWKAYAGRGFAIQTTFERLQASLGGTEFVATGGVVKYVDFARELTPVGNVFDHLATKDMPYEDEREFRLVFWDLDPRNAAHPKLATGLRVSVDVSMLAQAIVRSPYHEPLDREIERLMEQHEIKLVSSMVCAKCGDA